MVNKVVSIIKNKWFRRCIAIICIMIVVATGAYEYFKIFPWNKPLIFDQESMVVVDENIKGSKEQNNDYWISAHYFADGWAVNFWDSDFDNIDSDFTQMVSDGFNSIIIVVPWREFQPSVEDGEINQTAIEKLEYVFNKAEEHDLGVIMRVGYTYDTYNGEASEELYDRYYGIINKDSYRDRWLEYCEALYNVAEEHKNYWGAFMTWEDLWLACSRAKEVCGNNEQSNDFSMQIGYNDYMHRTYSAENIGEIFGEKFEEDDVVYIPDVNSTAFKTFYDYYDYFIMDLLEDTQEVFPNMSMEVRWDDDYYAESMPYEHNQTYSSENAGYSAAMYGIPMGMINDGERVSWEKALRKTYQIMKTKASQSYPKKYYVEQFLFYDNTQGMENNAQIIEEDIPEYIENSYKVLLKYTRGYGIWAYKDLRYNGVVNSEFAKGMESWDISSTNIRIIEDEGGSVCYIPEGETVSQDLTGRVGTEGDTLLVDFDVEISNGESAEIVVSINGLEQTKRLDSDGLVSLQFEGADFGELQISVNDADICIDNVNVYNFKQTNYIYDEFGMEKSCADAIRTLNNKLINTLNE